MSLPRASKNALTAWSSSGVRISSETEVGLKGCSGGGARLRDWVGLLPDSPEILGGEREEAGEVESVGVELRESGLRAARAARERGCGASPLPIMWLASA
jgi:hypothetical protein